MSLVYVVISVIARLHNSRSRSEKIPTLNWNSGVVFPVDVETFFAVFLVDFLRRVVNNIRACRPFGG